MKKSQSLKTRVIQSCLVGALALASTASSYEIMGWVPPYNLDNSKKILNHKAGGIKTSDWLTRFGLQFWGPTKEGGVQFVTHESELDDELVGEFVKWSQDNKVPVYLTIYNNNKVWDWELARSAFKDNRSKFVANLIATMEKYKLDGIDLDLEGNGNFEADREAYKVFVLELSKAVKAKGKKLTVDSFHSPCANAPHMGWWKDWVGSVDAIHSMGYADLYEGSKETFTNEGKVCENGANLFKYSWQVNYATQSGFPAPNILMGVPSWVDEWGSGGKGSSIQNHLDEVADLKTGIAIWDLPGMMDKKWKNPETFKALKAYKEKK